MLSTLVLCALLLVVYGDLLQVQVVHRHGARTHLKKDAARPGEENGATLLPIGVAQLKKLGELMRKEYLSPKALHHIRGATINFTSPVDVLSVSTNLDRTLSSARAFLLGLYPDTHALVPTKTFGAKENDYRLRGYAMCPRYDARVGEFLKSSAFKRRENSAAALLERVASAIGEKTKLTNAVNVLDRYELARLAHGEVPPLARSDHVALARHVNWVEANKHSSDVAGDLARPLFGTLLRYSREAAAHSSSGTPRSHRIIEYSAHYPTLLTLASAFREGIPVKPFDRVPPFSAAIVWETHTSSVGPVVRMRWYNGDGHSLVDISQMLPCSRRVNGACVLEYLSISDVSDAAISFCRSCAATAQTTAVCARGVRRTNIADNVSGSLNDLSFTCSIGERARAGVVGASICVGLVLVVACTILGALKMRNRRPAVVTVFQPREESPNESNRDWSPPDDFDPGWSGRYIGKDPTVEIGNQL